MDSVPENVGDASMGNNTDTLNLKGGLDSDGDFLDAETVLDGVNSPELTSADAKPWNSDGANCSDSTMGEDIHEDKLETQDVHEDESGSVKNFDSATSSTGDPTSPVGPSSPFLQAADSIQQNALRRLNVLVNGVSSLNTTLLENTSPTDLKRHVTQIIEAYGISVDDEDLDNIIVALSPLIERQQGHDNGIMNDASEGVGKIENEVENRSECDVDMLNQVEDEPYFNIANEIEDGHKGGVDPPNDTEAGEDKNIVGSSKQDYTESTEGDPMIVQSEDFNTLPARSEEIKNEVDLGLAPLDCNNGKDEKEVLETSENSVSSSETQVSKVKHYIDPEPEVIEWDKSNESYADSDVVNVLSQTHVDENVGNMPLVQELVGTGEAPSNPAGIQDAPKPDKSGESAEAGVINIGGTDSGNALMVHSTEEGKVESAGDKEEGPVNNQYGDGQEEIVKHKVEETTLEDKASLLVGSAEESGLDHDVMVAAEPKDVSEVPLKDEAKNDHAGVGKVKDLSEGSEDHASKQEVSLDNTEKGKGSSFEKSPGVGAATDTVASSMGAAGPSLPARPAGLGQSVPSLEHPPRGVQRSAGPSPPVRQSAVTTNEESGLNTEVSDGSDDSREKLQMIRVKFLRLAQRLGQSAHNVVVAQVLYRLGLAEQLRGGGRGSGSRAGAFSFERASTLAEEQEASGADDLEFACTVMVLGKSGVGKSATINSLFDEVKSGTNAYSPATNRVQEIVGTVHGIKLRVIDTPGLLSSFADQRRNERIMASVKHFIKKSPPDIVLYFDRLDVQGRDYGDLPLLRTITHTFGSAVWFNAIVVLTHASSAPPDGANGVPVSYEMFVAQRSHVVQQTIRQAAGDVRLMNPVSLVENHNACRRNRAGERVLPNGQVWKPQLLLLCFASKILAEANSLLKLQDNTPPAKPFGVRSRVPPLPFLLSSLLQSRAPLKLPDEQAGTDDDESEDDSDEEVDSEGEEYDDLPPFRRLTREELKLLDKKQRKIYAEELEYREKLFMKKQLKDERARKKEVKRRVAALPKDVAHQVEENFEENVPASVPVPMPDITLPPSFDSDTPTYRYRYLEAANQWLVRPVLETHGWDHDSGYDGLNVEKMYVVSKKVPVSVSGQVTKDKKEANLQMECAASFKNGEGKATQTGLDIQTIGKDLAYTLRSETRFSNFKRNRTTCGLAVTLLGDTMAAGMKIEDHLLVGKRAKIVVNGGALTGRGDAAYGGSLEVTVRDKDYPLGQFMSTFGLSVMNWHGDLAIGGNAQVQCKVGKIMVISRGNLNNRRAGQISIRVNSSEQLQIALIGLVPLLRTFINNRVLSSNQI